MSDKDANDYDKLKKALLTRYNVDEDGCRKRFREVKPETEETPDKLVIRLKNYLAKWLEHSGSSHDIDVLVDLIVKESLSTPIRRNTQYLIAHKQQLQGKSKTTVQPRRAE